jgi:hypothetical protein
MRVIALLFMYTILSSVSAGSLTELRFQPCERAHSVMVTDVNDSRIILYGGDKQQAGSEYYDDVWEFDLAEERWYYLDISGQPPSSRTWCSAAYDVVGDRMIIFGGWYEFSFFNDVWALNLTAGSETWQLLTTNGMPPAPREATSAVIDPVNNRLVVFAGYDHTTSACNDMWELDLTTLTWSQLYPTGPIPVARYAHTAIYDPNGHRMIVFGGIAPYSPGFNDVWVLDLTDGAEAWQQLYPTGSPPPARCRHFGVYDSVSHEMIIGFGYDYSGGTILFNDVWVLEIDSLKWRDVSNGGFAVNARRGACAAFDPDSGVTFVFGGHREYSSYCGETYLLSTDATGVYEYKEYLGQNVEHLMIQANPISSHVQMNGFVPEPMSITVKVVDTSGRLVKILLDNVRYSGRFTLNWNVTDNMGKRVPAGTYFCVLEIGDHMITEKAVVVK